MSSAIFVGSTFVDPGEESGTGWLSVMMGPNAFVSKRLEDYTVRLGTRAGGRHGKLTRLKVCAFAFLCDLRGLSLRSQRLKALEVKSQRKQWSKARAAQPPLRRTGERCRSRKLPVRSESGPGHSHPTRSGPSACITSKCARNRSSRPSASSSISNRPATTKPPPTAWAHSSPEVSKLSAAAPERLP